MKSKSVIFFILFLAVLQIQAQTEIIAHRGFWDTENSAQNSIAALIKANEIAVYGSEVDIHLSSDGVPVVNHDATVMLRGDKLFVQKTPANLLTQVKLKNGEPLPTFEQYLDAFENCKDTKLIIELKKQGSKNQEDELVMKVLEMVQGRELQNRVEYISFSLNMVKELVRLDPSAKVFYLSGDLAPNAIHEIGAAGIDYNLSVIKKNPHWVKECHDLGLKVNVWTVNKSEDIDEMITLGVDYITTDNPLLARELLNKQIN